MQKHVLVFPEPSHVHVFAAPHVESPGPVQLAVQKNVVGSWNREHSGAVGGQSLNMMQNLPMPFASPVSPGWPHVDTRASAGGPSIAGASTPAGFVPVSHATKKSNMQAVRIFEMVRRFAPSVKPRLAPVWYNLAA